MATERCQKLYVKAVVYKGNRILGAGENRPITPCDDHTCHHNNHCINSVHAEAKALLEAGKQAKGASMRTTHEPCHQCRKLIIAAGIEKVYYENEKHDPLNYKFRGEVKWVKV
ncbi:deaminase [Salicibibacter cibarius]|uniref:Deaminase n=1 Tax=Salicibibacter cibarius TaxID=2743000 RepID=A0A7T6Z167_9BACI|nr:deaminase [Salicibibacter cibarius]QQK75070.1 deaminase [Salicibibacter cibarius]QQK75131.1 deaminase [Salicibibacter cibarius]